MANRVFGQNFEKKGLKQKKWISTSSFTYWNRLGIKFQLKLTISIFWTKLSQKGYIRSLKNENHHRFLHIRFSICSKFQFQLTILIFRKKFPPKKILPVKNRKNKHRRWVLHIRISVSIKYQLKLTILISWTKFVQKEYFQSKTDKRNTTNGF